MTIWMLLATGTAAAAEPEKELYLWKVSKSGVKPSYLLGVCHMNVPLNTFLPEALEKKTLAKSEVVYTEIGGGQLDIDGILDALVAPTSLQSKVGDKVFNDVAYRVRYGLPATVLDLMPAWVPATVDISYMLSKHLPEGDPNVPILDVAVEQKAAALGIPVVPLETVDKQIKIFGEYDNVFALGLDPSSAPAARAERAVEALAKACTTFDASEVEAMLGEPDPTGFLTALLASRNQAWYDDLKKPLSEGKAFVAVGTSHMWGPGGLLAMMRTDGYTIERMSGVATPLPLPPNVADLDFRRPPVDQAIVDAWVAAYQATIPSLCDPMGLIRQCFLPQEQGCIDELNRAIPMCVNQYADLLPVPPAGTIPSPSAGHPAVAECIPTGIVLGGWARGTMGTAGMCSEVDTALDVRMID
jgi:uncharacterized protein YbaP (TraB family)